MRGLAVSRTYVRADSEIMVWSDLAGKRVAPGIPTSTAAFRCMTANKVLKTGAEIVHGSLADGIRDLQIGRVDAVHKGGPWNNFDAALMAAHHSVKLRAIGFSKEQASKLSEQYPQFLLRLTPSGTIKAVPEHPALWEIYSIAGAHTSSRLPVDAGYKIIKAVCEHWDEIAQAYPGSKGFHPIKDYVKIVPEGMELPLHAGVVRYAKEVGIEIPKGFIPPEYKD